MTELRPHLDRVEHHVERLLRAGVDLTRPVPSCPDWTVADLFGHVGGVLRWAANVVEERRSEAIWDWPQPSPDDDLEAWVRGGAARVVEVLGGADPSLAVWGWAGDGTASFWSRRMACETLVHRMDAELAASGAIGPVDSDEAVDAIDELVGTLLGNPIFGPKLTGKGETLHLHAGDAEGGEWTLTFAPDGLAVERGHAKADAALAGSAAELLAWAWRRGDTRALTVHGDAQVLHQWEANFPL